LATARQAEVDLAVRVGGISQTSVSLTTQQKIKKKEKGNECHCDLPEEVCVLARWRFHRKRSKDSGIRVGHDFRVLTTWPCDMGNPLPDSIPDNVYDYYESPSLGSLAGCAGETS
jgi:hypothetical protein